MCSLMVPEAHKLASRCPDGAFTRIRSLKCAPESGRRGGAAHLESWPQGRRRNTHGALHPAGQCGRHRACEVCDVKNRRWRPAALKKLLPLTCQPLRTPPRQCSVPVPLPNAPRCTTGGPSIDREQHGQCELQEAHKSLPAATCVLFLLPRCTSRSNAVPSVTPF